MKIYYLSNQSLYTGIVTEYMGTVAPMGATHIAPPDYQEGHARRFDTNTSTWSQVPLSEVTPKDTRTLDDLKAETKAQVTAHRWRVETGGISLPDGTKIATTIDDQNRISSALQGMSDAGMTEVDFKSESGWVKLSREQLTGVAALIANHVQACFTRERVLHETIDMLATAEALRELDITVGWPGKTV